MDKTREELQLLIGRTIILFQRYEYTFKSLLTLSLVEGTADTMEDNLKNRFDRISKKSLGQLVGLYIDEVVEPGYSSDALLEEKISLPHMTMRYSVESVSSSKSDIEEKYKSLVDERNFVVHNLISELVPGDKSTYESMISKLLVTNEKFESDLQDMNHTRQAIIDGYRTILNSDVFDT
jgi:hypothetical protein